MGIKYKIIGNISSTIGTSLSVDIHVLTTIQHAGIAVSEHGAFPLGSKVSITCSSDFGVSTINWLLDGQVVSTAVGSEGELSISEVSENDHDRMYTCRSTAPFGVQEHNITLQVEGMHPLS